MIHMVAYMIFHVLGCSYGGSHARSVFFLPGKEASCTSARYGGNGYSPSSSNHQWIAHWQWYVCHKTQSRVQDYILRTKVFMNITKIPLLNAHPPLFYCEPRYVWTITITPRQTAHPPLLGRDMEVSLHMSKLGENGQFSIKLWQLK